MRMKLINVLLRNVVFRTNSHSVVSVEAQLPIMNNPGTLRSFQFVPRFYCQRTYRAPQNIKPSSAIVINSYDSDISKALFQTKLNFQLISPFRDFHTSNLPTVWSHCKCARVQSYSLLNSSHNHYFIPDRSFRCNSAFHLKEDTNKNKNEGKGGIIQKFKQMWKDYWYVVIPVHVVTSIGWYGGFYLLIKSGVDIAAMLEWMGASEKYVEKLHNSNLGTFALMFACYKIATPVRYTVTIGGSTWTIKYLSQRGYMTSHEIKDELTERSVQLKRWLRKKEDLKDEWDKAWKNFAKRKQKKS